jgi:hypothetical protein
MNKTNGKHSRVRLHFDACQVLRLPNFQLSYVHRSSQWNCNPFDTRPTLQTRRDCYSNTGADKTLNANFQTKTRFTDLKVSHDLNRTQSIRIRNQSIRIKTSGIGGEVQ